MSNLIVLLPVRTRKGLRVIRRIPEEEIEEGFNLMVVVDGHSSDRILK